MPRSLIVIPSSTVHKKLGETKYFLELFLGAATAGRRHAEHIDVDVQAVRQDLKDHIKLCRDALKVLGESDGHF